MSSAQLRHLSPGRYAAILGGCFMVLCAVAAVSPLIGSSHLDLSRVFTSGLEGNQDRNIFFVVRLPHTVLGLLVGGALATSGCVFQALLRNPLATPYTLGVASGGSLGAVLSLALGMHFAYSLQVFSLLGVFFAVFVVFVLARSRGRMPAATLLLAGVTMAFFFSAMILYLLWRMDPNDAVLIVHWMMGRLDRFDDVRTLLAIAPLFAVGIVPMLGLAKPLNLLSVGEDVAMSLGVNLEQVRLRAFLSASVFTGLAVSLSGPIGFVGLIVPHTARLLFGHDHRILLPVCFLLGGSFLVVCDVVARSGFLASTTLPVGVVTAICGAPFFLWLLRSRRRVQSL